MRPLLEGGRRTRGIAPAERPLVSIVVVLFRAKDECARLLENILSFDHNDFELLIVDGGSHDGTVKLLEQRDDEIDYWLSEPDSGIYDAMNKGVALSRGEYILHMNAGDTLKILPRETLAMCLKEGVDVASFCVTMDRNEVFVPETGFPMRFSNTWHHQGTFYRRSPQLVYDTSYRVYGDFDLNQRWLKSGKKVRLFRPAISHHERDGFSGEGHSSHEIYRSIRSNFGRAHLALGYVWPSYQAFRRSVKRVVVYCLSLFGKSWPERP